MNDNILLGPIEKGKTKQNTKSGSKQRTRAEMRFDTSISVRER